MYFYYIQRKIKQKDTDKLFFLTGMNAPIPLEMEPTHVLAPIFLGHAVDNKRVKDNLFNRDPLIFKELDL